MPEIPHKIEGKNICKNFYDGLTKIPVLRNINFYADANEFVSFVGPSGCGKSTLFNIVTSLLKPSKGTVFIDGKEVTGHSFGKVGYVLQKDLLMPWRTIMDNVIVGLQVTGVKKKEARARAEKFFESYNMKGYEDKYPADLSGGMKQRAAIMRTMVTNPDIILMDEAYKALDYPLKIALESELLETVHKYKKTIIFVTHDIEEAVTLSDRVYIMKAKPGEIVGELKINLSTHSTKINERRLDPKFNEYYEHIWRNIGLPATF